MAELLGCPFCGSEASIFSRPSGGHYAYCTNEDCGAEAGGTATATAAIAAWNRRAPSPTPATTTVPDERLREMWRENTQAHAAAMRMVADAIEELFGPVASLESAEASLLRGPEPHHRAEGIIEALQRVSKALRPAPVAQSERAASMWAEVVRDEFGGYITWYCDEAASKGEIVDHKVLELRAETFPIGTKLTIVEPHSLAGEQ